MPSQFSVIDIYGVLPLVHEIYSSYHAATPILSGAVIAMLQNCHDAKTANDAKPAIH